MKTTGFIALVLTGVLVGCRVQAPEDIQIWTAQGSGHSNAHATAIAGTPITTQTICIQAEHARLTDLLKRVATFQGWKLVFSQEVHFGVCTVHLTDVDPMSAIESILDVHDMKAILTNGELRVSDLTEDERIERHRIIPAPEPTPPTVSTAQQAIWPRELPKDLMDLPDANAGTNLNIESVFLTYVGADDIAARLLPLIRPALGESVAAFPSRQAIVLRALPPQMSRLKRVCAFLDAQRWSTQSVQKLQTQVPEQPSEPYK